MMALWCSKLSQELSKFRSRLEDMADFRQELNRGQGLRWEETHRDSSVTHVWPFSHWNLASVAPYPGVIQRNIIWQSGRRSAERIFTCPPTWVKAAVSTLYWWAMKMELKECCSLWSSARVAQVLLWTLCYLKGQSKEEQPLFDVENCACVRSPCLTEAGARWAFHCCSYASLSLWPCACRNSCRSAGIPQKSVCL